MACRASPGRATGNERGAPFVPGLLDHVGQLVGQKSPVRDRLRLAEDDVTAEREGGRVDRTGGGGGLRIAMDSDLAEIAAEPRLELGAGGGAQRPPG